VAIPHSVFDGGGPSCWFCGGYLFWTRSSGGGDAIGLVAGVGLGVIIVPK
jgi:hypothetical protein